MLYYVQLPEFSVASQGDSKVHRKITVCLGVTLDRTLSYKQHIEKVKGKVRTRNNLLHKLANSSWGAILPPCELLPLHSDLLFSCRICLSCVGKIIPMQRKLTPPLMTAADASLGACARPTNVDSLMSWLVSPHLAFAYQ